MESRDRLAVFFIPLPEPIGLNHGDTFSFIEEGNSGLDAVPVYPSDGLPPLPNWSAEENFTSLKIWQVKSEFTHLIQQTQAVTKVATVVIPATTFTEAGGPSPDGAYLTVVEAVTPLNPSWDDPEHTALDQCLGRINQLISSYGTAVGRAIAPVSIERLPMATLWATRSLDGQEWSKHLWLHNTNDVQLNVPRMLDDLPDNQVSSMLTALEGNPLYPFLELSSEAARAFHTEGDYRTATILAASSCEVLFDTLLAALLWEEGLEPGTVAAEFFGRSSSIGQRVAAHYSSRLGSGHWKLAGQGPVATWYSQLARLRNRCVHRGYRPTRQEVNAAFAAKNGLRNFVSDRLMLNRKPYPYASAFLSNRVEAPPDAQTKRLVWRDWHKILSEARLNMQ